MIPRQTPLCLQHFLRYARETFFIFKDLKTLDTPRDLLASNEKAITRKQKPIPAPTRVQPRRAAKDKPINYNETELLKKLKMEEEIQNQKRTKANIGQALKFEKMLQLKIGRLIDNLHTETECIFGFEPWTCWLCERDMAVRACRLDKSSQKGVSEASEAEIEPSEGSLLLLDWKFIHVPVERRFTLGDRSFTVDTCSQPMVLML